MLFIVVTNVVASQPPERQLTGTPTACAKIMLAHDINKHKFVQKVAKKIILPSSDPVG